MQRRAGQVQQREQTVTLFIQARIHQKDLNELSYKFDIKYYCTSGYVLISNHYFTTPPMFTWQLISTIDFSFSSGLPFIPKSSCASVLNAIRSCGSFWSQTMNFIQLVFVKYNIRQNEIYYSKFQLQQYLQYNGNLIITDIITQLHLLCKILIFDQFHLNNPNKVQIHKRLLLYNIFLNSCSIYYLKFQHSPYIYKNSYTYKHYLPKNYQLYHMYKLRLPTKYIQVCMYKPYFSLLLMQEYMYKLHSAQWNIKAYKYKYFQSLLNKLGYKHKHQITKPNKQVNTCIIHWLIQRLLHKRKLHQLRLRLLYKRKHLLTGWPRLDIYKPCFQCINTQFNRNNC
ncbi:Hypothetical_protein [Hexamita inflata]|uniref:Hypothetical_protein n=1 Tax=Hexamita inflata TaxID=28002 RepID=A0AA86QSS7_9EUKA|nr:Hypothetical protein HINF_LOCUS46239 [Hexamita inflata]